MKKKGLAPLVVATGFFFAKAHLQKGHPQQPLD
jgi:hypothetical protein